MCTWKIRRLSRAFYFVFHAGSKQAGELFTVGYHFLLSDREEKEQRLVDQTLPDKPVGSIPLVIGDLNANLDTPRPYYEPMGGGFDANNGGAPPEVRVASLPDAPPSSHEGEVNLNAGEGHVAERAPLGLQQARPHSDSGGGVAADEEMSLSIPSPPHLRQLSSDHPNLGQWGAQAPHLEAGDSPRPAAKDQAAV